MMHGFQKIKFIYLHAWWGGCVYYNLMTLRRLMLLTSWWGCSYCFHIAAIKYSCYRFLYGIWWLLVTITILQPHWWGPGFDYLCKGNVKNHDVIIVIFNHVWAIESCFVFLRYWCNVGIKSCVVRNPIILGSWCNVGQICNPIVLGHWCNHESLAIGKVIFGWVIESNIFNICLGGAWEIYDFHIQ